MRRQSRDVRSGTSLQYVRLLPLSKLSATLLYCLSPEELSRKAATKCIFFLPLLARTRIVIFQYINAYY